MHLLSNIWMQREDLLFVHALHVCIGLNQDWAASIELEAECELEMVCSTDLPLEASSEEWCCMAHQHLESHHIKVHKVTHS